MEADRRIKVRGGFVDLRVWVTSVGYAVERIGDSPVVAFGETEDQAVNRLAAALGSSDTGTAGNANRFDGSGAPPALP